MSVVRAARPPGAGLPSRAVVAQAVKGASANFVLPLSSFATAPVLARALGPEDRGSYAALASPVLLVAVIGTLGVQDLLSHLLRSGRLSTAGALALTRRAVPVLALGNVVLALAFSAVSARGGIRFEFALAFLLACAPFAVGNSILQGIGVGCGWFSAVNANRVATGTFRILAFGLLYLLHLLDLTSAVAVVLLSLVVSLGWTILLVERMRRRTGDGRDTTSQSEVPPQLVATMSAKFLLGAGLAVMLARFDQTVALPIAGSVQLGLYAIAVAVSEVPVSGTMAIRMLVMGREGAADDRSFAVRGFVVGFSWGSVCAVVGLLSAPIVIPLLFGPRFEAAVLPTQILLAGLPFAAALNVASGWFIRVGRANDQAACFGVALAVNVVMLFVLGSRWGAEGLAYASILGAGAGAAVAIVLITRARGAASSPEER